jgi:hypothetical protein
VADTRYKIPTFAIGSHIFHAATEDADGMMSALDKYILDHLAPGGSVVPTNVEWFRPAGVTDQGTIQLAVDSGLPLAFPDRTYEISAPIINTLCHYIVCYNTTWRIANGAIVNTDASHDNFVPFMQTRGVQGFYLCGRLTVDGNRDNQTYPATQPNFGRGTNAVTSAGRRFNGCLEFVAGTDNLTPCSDVVIAGDIEVKNGYLNGIVFAQVQRAEVFNVYTHDNTVNGISGENCTTWLANGTRHYRDGVSAAYPAVGANGNDGDRSGIQFREALGTFTAAQLEMPWIASTDGNNLPNYDVSFVNCSAEECQVEGFFQRMCFPGKMINCYSLNVGYSRSPAASFHCAHFWCEGGWYERIGNVGIQRTNNSAAGYQVPDGMVLQTFNGDGSGSGGGVPITYGGTFKSTCIGERYVCGDTASPGRVAQQNYFRGARIYSECDVSQLYIEGVDSAPFILIQNDVNFNNLPPRNVTLRDITLENGTNCDLVISVARFSNPDTSTPSEWVWDNIKVRNVSTTRAGTDDHAIIDFATNMSAFVITATFSRLDFDCTNSGSAFNYNGVRMRSGAGSILDFNFANCANGFSPWRVSGPTAAGATGGFSKLRMTGYLSNCHRCWLIDATNWTANADVVEFDIDAVGITDELFNVAGFTPAGNPTFKMNAVYAKYRVQGSSLSRTFPAGAGNITTTDDNFFAEAAWYQWGPNNDNYGSNNPTVDIYDMKRRFSTFATLTAAKPYYVGELVIKTDDNTIWMGVTKTGTTALWSQLSIPSP